MNKQNWLDAMQAKLEKRVEAEFARLGDDHDRRADWLIGLYAGLCGGVALQPLPFADILLLSPLQVLMVQHMARAYEIPLAPERAREIFGEITAVVGLGMVAQQTVLGLYKLGLPFAGGLFTFPLVFATTWAIGQVMKRYFQYLVADEPVDRQALKALFKEQLKAGKKRARDEEPPREL